MVLYNGDLKLYPYCSLSSSSRITREYESFASCHCLWEMFMENMWKFNKSHWSTDGNAVRCYKILLFLVSLASSGNWWTLRGVKSATKNIARIYHLEIQEISYYLLLHIKLGLMKQTTETLATRNSRSFEYTLEKFPKIPQAKLKIIFVKPRIREVLKDINFKTTLDELELPVWIGCLLSNWSLPKLSHYHTALNKTSVNQ